MSTLIYTKFYPSAEYEYDSRGIVTINVPFNGKVVGTYKYDSSTGSTLPPEVSYIHNSYNGTPVLLTDSNASTTAVMKRDTWGSVINNQMNKNQQTPTDFGYTGHVWNDRAEIHYAHARWLNNSSKIWLSHDPFSIENFSADIWLTNLRHHNSYSYATQDPANKVDPDGKLTIIVPGTYYDNRVWNWSNTKTDFFYKVAGTFADNVGGETIIWNDYEKWSGKNSNEDRSKAAKELAKFINNYDYKDGEKLNIVAHSHGGNVVKEASHLISRQIDTLATLGTPQRSDYNINTNMVNTYINVYSVWDGVQISGGNLFDNKQLSRLGNSYTPLQGGPAGRVDNNTRAINVNVGISNSNPVKMHNQMWGNTNIWDYFVAPIIRVN